MTETIIKPVSRRFFVKGLAALIAAPAVIRVIDLMPISVERDLVLVHQMNRDLYVYRWFNVGDWVSWDDIRKTRKEYAEALGYTFIPDGTVITGEEHFPQTNPIRHHPDGGESRLAYVPKELYEQRQAFNVEVRDFPGVRRV